MAHWSAEHATNAYLKTLRMGHKVKEPDVSEFISALAAGNNAQLMVVACANAATTVTLALVAAALQTGGLVVCIVSSYEEFKLCKKVLGIDACNVEIVVGDGRTLLLTDYTRADFVLIDCNLENHECILEAVQASRKQNGPVVLGYNAFGKGLCWSGASRTQLLPIGEGLLVTRIPASPKLGTRCGYGKTSHWVVKVDKCTGEEHVFRVKFPQGKQIEA